MNLLMQKAIKTALVVLVAGGILLLTLGWMILAFPLFSGLRQSVVSQALTDEFGQRVVISGDVRVQPGLVSRVYASNVSVPDTETGQPVLAELQELQFKFDTLALLQADINFDDLHVIGLHVDILQDENGRSNWPSKPEPNVDSAEAPAPYLIGALRRRGFSFKDITLNVENRQSGFEFQFNLESLDHILDSDNRVSNLVGSGTVNDQVFEIEGTFPEDDAFELDTVFGDTTLRYDGSPLPEGAEVGHSARLSVEVDSLQELLEVLQLEAPTAGRASLSTVLTRKRGLLQVEDLSLQVDFADGAGLSVSGDISNLLTVDGLDLLTNAWFFPEESPPAPAQSLKDLEITGFSAKTLGNDGQIVLEDIHVQSNSIDVALAELGPASVGRVHRTPDEKLALSDIRLAAGPANAPFFKAKGAVGDLMNLQDISFKGELQASAEQVFLRASQDMTQFGGITAKFEVTDNPGYLALSSLELSSKDTDLWNLEGRARLGNVARLEDFELSVAFGMPDSKIFLEALQLAPIDGGAFDLSLAVSGRVTDFATTIGLQMGLSRLVTEWTTRLAGGIPIIAGRLSSESVDMSDAAKMVDAIIELSKLERSSPQTADTGRAPLKPLVIEEEPRPETKPELRPLVLPEPEPGFADLLDIDRVLSNASVSMDIDIAEIKGQQGVSRLTSALIVEQGQASLGPLDFAYGKGQVSVSAGIDLVKSPEFLKLSGSTGGWDFGEILDAVGAGIAAYGTLNGRFELVGNYASATSFLKTARGWAHVSLANGRIGTTLIDLAGMGVLPWVFSKEVQQGYSRIVCIEAPLQIGNGRVSFDSFVLETDSVQLVAKGMIDLAGDRIELSAEPRPVGKPLARSAWPFTVSGRLSSPQFNLSKKTRPSQSKPGEARSEPGKRVTCKPDIGQLR